MYCTACQLFKINSPAFGMAQIYWTKWSTLSLVDKPYIKSYFPNVGWMHTAKFICHHHRKGMQWMDVKVLPAIWHGTKMGITSWWRLVSLYIYLSHVLNIHWWGGGDNFANPIHKPHKQSEDDNIQLRVFEMYFTCGISLVWIISTLNMLENIWFI